MKNFYLGIVLVLFLGLTAFRCGESGTTSVDTSKTGTLSIRLTDAPGDFEAVNVSFSEISAHINDQWITVIDSPQTIDLLEWNNSNSIEIGNAEIPAGRYTQIRLKIDSAAVVKNNQSYPADVPSGAQTGLKLITSFTVTEGASYSLMLDFDADRSVIRLGPKNNPRGFKLKPTIRAVAIAETGSISGLVLNPQNLPVAYALQNADTVTSSVVNSASGAFMLSFLPAGNYTVSIQDSAGFSFSQSSVTVNTGQDTDLGNITLQ